jgi:hypothetical protein
MLDQRAVARLAVAQRGLGALAVGGVAQADDVHRAAVEPRLGHRELGGKVRAVRMQAEGLVRREIGLRVVEARRELLEFLGERLPGRELRQQEAERPSGRFGLDVAEHALAGRVQRNDVAGFVDGHDHVLHVIEHGLELAGRALAQLARERRRLVGHELHRAHDAAALFFGSAVGAVDRGDELLEVELAVGTRRVLHLLFQQPVHHPSSHLPGPENTAGRHITPRGSGARSGFVPS